jgi:hypothetical protein
VKKGWLLPLLPTADSLLPSIGLGTCAWIGVFVILRALRAYPLDAFEEYELHKAMDWWQGTPIYGPASNEPYPEAYPPLYLWILGVWQQCFGHSFVVPRSLSLFALAGLIGAGWWALDSGNRWLTRIVFLATLLSCHALVARSFEVGRLDTVFVFFVSIGVVAARHRTTPEVVASSLGLWLASLTKQNAPIILVAIVLWHFVEGRRRWAFAWGSVMVLIVAGSYAILNWASGGRFWGWVFVWTAGHGVDVVAGLRSTGMALFSRWPVGACILLVGLAVRRRCLWTWCVVSALALAAIGLSKVGGRESHLMPFAFCGSLALATWFSDWWERQPARWVLVLLFGATVWTALPMGRDLRWLEKRTVETSDWVAAVRDLHGRVAVSHHFLLAERAGADCFFSDLILKFRGLEVPSDVRSRIEAQEFDYLVLGTNPEATETSGWSALIEENYDSVGRLHFSNVARVLPDRVFRARRLVE